MSNKKALLDRRGNLAESGFWRDFPFEYNSKKIRALRSRIKEWDFYQFQTGDWVIQSTIAECLVVDLFQAGLFNVRTNERYEICKICPHFFSPLRMASDPTDDFSYRIQKPGLDFLMSNVYGHRVIKVKAQIDGFEDFTFEVEGGRAKSNAHALTIAHSFAESKKMFYLNYKENIFNGSCHIAAKRAGEAEAFTLNATDLTGVLDWGRGYWPYNNEWNWGNYSGFTADGKAIGWNLGYGFGTCPETENIVYYDGKAYKLGSVIASLNLSDYGTDISLVDDDEKLRLNLKFVYDNYTETKVLWYQKWCHQVWYEATGTIVAGDKTVSIDHALVFFEHEENHW